MSGKLITSALILSTLGHTCSAWSCGAGQVAKDNPAQQICAGTTYDACDSPTCCKTDITKCGVLSFAEGAACLAAGKYHDTSKVGNTKGDDAAASCCTSFATCSAASTANSGLCPAGYTLKADPDTIKCAGDVDSCSVTVLGLHTCCQVDTTKCAVLSLFEGPACLVAGKYHDTSKVGNTKGDDAVANCCTSFATCSAASTANSGLCPAGYKLKADPDTIKCTGDVDSCSVTVLGLHTCCQVDTTKCAVLSLIEGAACLAAGKFHDTSKVGNTKGDDAVANCCTVASTCATIDSDEVDEGRRHALPAMVAMVAVVLSACTI